MYKKICVYCKKEFVANVPYRKYCNNICRSRFNQSKSGKSAKDFKCLQCGTLFKRRSAKNTKCLNCREILKTVKSIKDGDVPKIDPKKEAKMIKAWLKTQGSSVLMIYSSIRFLLFM